MNRLLLILSVGISSQIFAQYDIDLSKGNRRESVEHGKTLTIQITNKLWGVGYDVSIVKKFIPIPDILIPANEAPVDSTVEAIPDNEKNDCADLISATSALRAVTEEKDIPNNIKKLEKVLESHEPSDCPEYILEAQQTIDQTKDTIIWKGALKPSEELVIEVTRKLPGGEELKWVYTYTTDPIGSWDLSFAATLTTQWITTEDIYFSQSEGSAFRITKEQNRRSVTYAPALMFTFYPYARQNDRWGFGISPGIGADFSDPMLFLCGTLTHWRAVRFHAGFAFTPQYVLKGQYKNGQVISENLSRDQLHDKLLKPNFFIALSLKLSENIFR